MDVLSVAQRPELVRCFWCGGDECPKCGGSGYRTRNDARSLVFVDEMGTNISLSPLYGYAPKGERLRLSVPRNRGKNTTLLSSMTTRGMGPSMAVDGATTAPVFETYVEHILAPHLKQGQVVVMDKPRRTQTEEDQGTDRRARLRAVVSATLLSGPQPDRDLPLTMHLQTQTILSLASKGCSGYWRW